MSRAEELNKRRKAIKATECKHRNGPIHNERCKAGVHYREMVGGEDFGWMARMPCLPDSPLNKEPQAKCDKYEAMTAEEIEAEERDILEHSTAMFAALKAIKETKLQSGTVPCPKCKTGKVHFSVAKLNGHIWGKCETTGCLSWMM